MNSPLSKTETTELFNYLRLNRAYTDGRINHDTLMDGFFKLSRKVHDIVLNNAHISFEVI